MSVEIAHGLDRSLPEGLGPYCVCGSPMTWEDCWDCGGDGFINRYEEDPLWYDEDDDSPCETCFRKGGWYFCWKTVDK